MTEFEMIFQYHFISPLNPYIAWLIFMINLNFLKRASTKLSLPLNSNKYSDGSVQAKQ